MSTFEKTPIDVLAVNTMRCLAMDAVQQANSGHPGTPISLSPLVYTIWQDFLRYDPADPIWPNRDRFVLSCGHACMLLYSILHLTGVKNVKDETQVLDEPGIPLSEIKRFRQLESHTPGHPEYRYVPGAETSTGPLGQGCGNSVGMAIAGKWLAANYNKPGYELFDYNVYVVCSDGDMMEGISGEAASIAGHLKLDNLCWFYDNNHISIEGKTSLTFDENVGDRFKAYGWNVLHVKNAEDRKEIAAAIQTFQKTKDRPTFVVVDSHIAYGVPGKQDSAAAHGEALGEEAIKGGKKFFGWPEDAKFLVPDGVYEHFQQGIGKRGKTLRDASMAKFKEYQEKYPDLAKQLQHMMKRELPDGWDKNIPTFPADAKGKATRESGGEVLNAFAKNIPWLIGGSADLAPSTKTLIKGAGDFEPNNYGARNFHFGIREHAMGAIVNGLSLSRVRPYGSTFLIFSDYMKNPMRLAALMEVPTLYVFTHDSIGLGEDGPTHQSIEQLAGLRAIPYFMLLRPGDANETAEAWRIALEQTRHPVALVLTRQALPTFDRTKYAAASGLRKGAYVMGDAASGKPEVILMGTGSEVQLCVAAYEKLTAEGVKARVVSMPSWDLFESQPQEYRDSVLPPNVTARVAVEAAAELGWSKYVGPTGKVICMRTFGMSAPYKDVLKHFGFTPEHVYQAAKEQLASVRR
jgi:transketolase